MTAKLRKEIKQLKESIEMQKIIICENNKNYQMMKEKNLEITKKFESANLDRIRAEDKERDLRMKYEELKLDFHKHEVDYFVHQEQSKNLHAYKTVLREELKK